MARFTSGASDIQQTRDLLRSFELICLGIGTATALAIAAAAPSIGTHWLNAQALPPGTVAEAVMLMGMILGVRLGEGLYRSCLVGLQHQVGLNMALAVLATLRSAGAVAILFWADRSIQAFFLWQAGVSLLSLIVLGLAVHRLLPKAPRRARFSKTALASVGRFAGGMVGINLLALLLTQVDKLLLSKLLPLDQYGYYMLATTVAGAMLMFTGPITQAVFPAMVEDVGAGREQEVGRKFHHGAALVTAIMAPMGLALILFARPILYAWSGDAVLADATAPLLSLLAAGTLMNALMQMPYYLQVAYGWTGLAIRVNLVALAVLIPALLITVPRWGPVAAAWVWVALNFAYLLVVAPLMFRRIQRGETWRWYRDDLLRPAAAAALVLGLAWLVPLAPDTSRLVLAGYVCAAAGIALGAALLALAGTQSGIRQLLAGKTAGSGLAGGEALPLPPSD
jgi:O-antigen/teichoic acid export membrane protein